MGMFRERKNVQIHGEPDSYLLCCSQNVSFHLSDHNVSDLGLDLIFGKMPWNISWKSINPYPYEGSSGPEIECSILQQSESIAAYATEIPLSCTYLFHLSGQPWYKKFAEKHRPTTVQIAYWLKKKHCTKQRLCGSKGNFHSPVWGNFHESSRTAKSSSRIICSPMFLIKNMSYLKCEKNNTAARLFFPIGKLFGNISAKTESNLW